MFKAKRGYVASRSGSNGRSETNAAMQSRETAEGKINSRVDEWMKHVQRSRDVSSQKRARRLIQLSGTPVEIVRAEVCNGHNAPRILRSHRRNARYTINEQERARRKRLLNPGGPLHSLLPAPRRCLQRWNKPGTVREHFVSLSISLFLPLCASLRCRSISTRS